MQIFSFDKNSEFFTPKNSPKNHQNKVQKNSNNSYKDSLSQNDNFFSFHPQGVLSWKNNRKNILNSNIITSLDNIKRRRQSYHAGNILRREYEKDNDSELNKMNKRRTRRKTGVFNNPVNKIRERRLSLFSNNSNINNNNACENNKLFSIYPYESYSQNTLSRNLIEHYKKKGMNKIKDKKNEKEIRSPSSEIRSKNQKKENKSSLKFESNKNNNKFKMFENIEWTPRMLWDYLCLCRTKEKNDINILNKFRQKLLSEEYLYILHLNMFIFKQKLGCKSYLDKNNLLEELYNDM